MLGRQVDHRIDNGVDVQGHIGITRAFIGGIDHVHQCGCDGLQSVGTQHRIGVVERVYSEGDDVTGLDGPDNRIITGRGYVQACGVPYPLPGDAGRPYRINEYSPVVGVAHVEIGAVPGQGGRGA